MRKFDPDCFRGWVFALAALALLGCGTAARAATQGLPADCKAPEGAVLSNASIVQATGESLQHKRWQPQGGVIQFAVKSFEGLPANASFNVCFRWKITDSDNKNGYVQVTPNRLDRNNDGTVWTITVTIPENFPELAPGQKSAKPSWFLPLVPLADVRILVVSKDTDNKTKAATVDTTIGITYPWAATLLALATVLIALGILLIVSNSRLTHPGIKAASLPLRIISTPNGRASLSQLQIVLWTLVVAAAAVYVMSLSGDLIQITEGTLVLLGIAGAAGVATKLHNESQIAKAENIAGAANVTATPPQQPPVQQPPVQQPPVQQPAVQQPAVQQPAVQQAGPTPQQAADARQNVKNMLDPPSTQTPRWSDLIVTEGMRDGVWVREIDVARFQMLLFLLITVVFVLLNVLTTYVIPEIPTGFLTLMGISNGVYLGSKVAQGQ
jgi:hypothetical protein